MNPSDDEQSKVVADQTSKEIEELLEPQAIPDERIVRHAEKNDSYREAPTVDEEEIVQLPLEPPEEDVVEKGEPPVGEEQVVDNNLSSTASTSENISTVTKETLDGLSISQKDIQPEIALGINEVVEEQVSQQPEPVVYHTISGGPETFDETRSNKQDIPKDPSLEVGAYTNAASGYTIPDPHYAPFQSQPVEYGGNFGMTLFLIILGMLGGVLAYVYFFIPEVSDQFFSALLIIKDQVFKK
jgi:hypothetical protein